MAESLRVAHAIGALRTNSLARVSVDTTVQPKAISFPTDFKLLHAAIKDTERLAGREIERAYVDKGYRGHDAPNPRHVFISGQQRGVFGAIILIALWRHLTILPVLKLLC